MRSEPSNDSIRIQRRQLSRWMKLIMFLLPGCRTATQIDYLHQPTANLTQNWDIGASVHRPFSCGGIVLSPRFVRLDHETTAVKLLVASSRPTRTLLSDVQLRDSTGGSLFVGTATHEVNVDVPVKGHEAFKGELMLAELSSAQLDAQSEAGDLVLTLNCASASGDTVVLSFDVTRVETTYMVTR